VHYRDGIIEAIGNTPLIKLKRASEETGCLILGKAEFMNPGQSVKDRAALFIIRDALTSGRLQPGGTVVEGTAGNTGIGLALVGNALGLKTVIVIPDTQSDEKKDMLRLAGAELIEVPAVPYKDPNNYVKYSGRLAEQLAATAPHGAIWANQFDNVANRQGHIETTAPEIWNDMQGKVDGFICAVGTGGDSRRSAGLARESGGVLGRAGTSRLSRPRDGLRSRPPHARPPARTERDASRSPRDRVPGRGRPGIAAARSQGSAGHAAGGRR